jgi:hypothetical protein
VEPTVVPLPLFKLGGSLLDLPDWPRRVGRLLEERGVPRCLLVVGGGTAADVVREWDRRHALGDETAHRLALESLRLTAALATTLLPGARLVRTRPEAESAWRHGPCAVVDVPGFVELAERGDPRAHPAPLPHTWDVTSDALAAWIALRWPASELWLLKSTGLPAADLPFDEAAARGLVDRHFPRIAPQVPRLAWVDLRSERPVPVEWRPD